MKLLLLLVKLYLETAQLLTLQYMPVGEFILGQVQQKNRRIQLISSPEVFKETHSYFRDAFNIPKTIFNQRLEI